MAPRFRTALLAAAALSLQAAAHVEDVCIEPGAVRNFYQYSSSLGCGYAPAGLRGTLCRAAVLMENMEKAFKYNTTCRGIVHFDSVYFMAASLGFRQEIAYWLAAFSQAVDFSEFVMLDSCGRPMAESFWTPPMKGLVRTLWSAGGTNMHFGVPFVGEQEPGRCRKRADGGPALDCPELRQSEKSLGHWPDRQRGSRSTGCVVDARTRADYASVSQECPGLNFTLAEGNFYEGPLTAWKRWAFNQTEVLCSGGYTTLGPGGNPTTGRACPSGGVQYFGDVSGRVTSLIPFLGFLRLGEQLIDYDCVPECACYQNCSRKSQNSDFQMVNERRVRMTPNGSTFGLYLQEACEKRGRACMSQGGPVPELVARAGILLHYYADRTSHWYCTDAPGSGVMLQRAADKDYEYDLVLYLQGETCGFSLHSDTHYWEQGMGLADSYLSPGTVGALYQMYDVLAEFAGHFRAAHPEWFDSKVGPLGSTRVIGTRARPGYLYDVVRHREAKRRVEAHTQALRTAGLPPLPGWEGDCGLREAEGLPVGRLAGALAESLRARHDDCGVRALLGAWGGPPREGETAESRAERAARAFDSDGSGWLSLAEIEAWERHPAVAGAFAQCGGREVFT